MTIFCSNLRDLVTPDLVLQLDVLKEHIGIKSFKGYRPQRERVF